MLAQLKHLDRLLRGDATQLTALRFGTVAVPSRQLLLSILLLGMLYGLCMASYAIASGADMLLARVVATMIKVPALFLLTLFITFPSLYAFNALVGSNLTLEAIWGLIVSALAVMVAVLASLGPIVFFFSVSTDSYPFILLLNVLVFAVAGILGLRFLMLTIERLRKAPTEAPAEDDHTKVALAQFDSTLTGQETLFETSIQKEVGKLMQREGPLDRRRDDQRDPKSRTIFRIWVVVFGLVGAQLSFVMRPFLGDPTLPNATFDWIAPRESSFFEAVIGAIVRLIS